MSKKKTVLSFLIIFTMVLAIALTARADDQISTEDMIVPKPNPYAYGTAPDGFFVFLYHGYNPYLTEDLDTSACVLEHLYVHNKTTNEIVDISPQTVTAYTTTKDALYYVTEDQAIYTSDYLGNNHTAVYQCTTGYIRDISTYWNMLILVVGEDKLLFVDSTTGAVEDSLTLDGLDWIFMLSESEVVVATISGDFFVYQTENKILIPLDSEMEANNRINQAVFAASNTGQNSLSQPAVLTSVTPKIQENNIPLPLIAYPANQVPNSTYPRPLSWFHVNGQEGCSSSNCDRYAGTGECEGFARYAHDAYLHILDDTISYSAWKTSRHSVETDYRFDGDPDIIKAFFNSLNPGAYVRYGRDSDETPANGVHSIVFVNIDEGGIWAYECNQAYDNDPNHGCGVHYQYYAFDALARRYQYAAHYVNHSFTGGKTAANYLKHHVACSDCRGYLVQSHTGSTSYAQLNSSNHKVFYSCCNGFVQEPHQIAARMCLKCDYDF